MKRAHVVGNSFGGAISRRLALDSPEFVHTLSVLEPALMVGQSADGYRESLTRSAQHDRDVGAEAAVDEALRARWPRYWAGLEKVLHRAFEQAVADA